MIKIGISGASGQLGRAIVKELAARGASGMVGISRAPENVPDPAEGRLGDYNRPETLVEAYRGLDRLVIIPSADVQPGVRDRQFAAAIDAAADRTVPKTRSARRRPRPAKPPSSYCTAAGRASGSRSPAGTSRA